MPLKKQSISFFVALVLIMPMTLFSIIHWIEKKYNALPVYKGENYTLADFNLKNQDNNSVSLKEWQNKIVVADFFFTHCTSICPKLTKNIQKVQASFAGENDIQFNSFSVDPVRDNVDRLKLYATQFNIGSNWNLLTGDKADIYRLGRKSFSITESKGNGDSNDFIHSEKLVLIDKHQQIRGYYNGTSEKDTEKLINDIKKLKGEE